MSSVQGVPENQSPHHLSHNLVYCLRRLKLTHERKKRTTYTVSVYEE